MKIPIKYKEPKGSIIFLLNENRQHDNDQLAAPRGFLDLPFLIYFKPISSQGFAESNVQLMRCQCLIPKLQLMFICTTLGSLCQGWKYVKNYS